MLSRRLIISFCAFAMVLAVGAKLSFAQEPLDSRTEFTFNAPIQLPGATLPPGTYTFRFVDSTTSRKVMQVVAKDGSNKTYGLFPTISAQRTQPADNAELRFMETAAGQPTAVKTWWYPGNTIGREFIYPKDQARQLAKATNTDVLTTKSDNVATSDMSSVDLTYVTPSGEERAAAEASENSKPAAMNEAPSTTQTTAAASPEPFENRSNATAAAMPANESAAANTATAAPAATATAKVNESPAPASSEMHTAPVQESTMASNTTAHRARLPKTDTTLPLLALMGFSSLMAGGSLRLRRK